MGILYLFTKKMARNEKVGWIPRRIQSWIVGRN